MLAWSRGGMVMGTADPPTISIVMPLYNKSGQVLATLDGVLRQTVSNWELVVIDDGSTDNSVSLVQSLNDSRISIHHQRNAGVSAARNHGVRLCRSDLIAFLDADDLWHPDFLSTIIRLHKDFPEARWYGTAYEIRPARGEGYACRLHGIPENFQRGFLSDYFTVASRSDPPIATSATAMQKEAILAIGGFPVGIVSGEDLLTWARMAIHYPLAYETKPLSKFLISGIERPPDRERKVGRLLEELAREHSSVDGIRSYVGLWYRMEATMAMRFGEKSLARSMAWRCLRYDPGHWRTAATLLLTLLPKRISDLVQRMAQRHRNRTVA